MGKCKICGTDIPDDQEICEKCQSDLDAVSDEDLDLEGLEDLDFSEIELPELSGDVYETDLEFNLEDIDNNLENPDIFVHDFEVENPQLSEKEQENIDTKEVSLDVPEDVLDMTENVADEIPDISDLLGDVVQADHESFDIPKESVDTQSGEGLLPEDIDSLLAEPEESQEDMDLLDLLSETEDAIEEPENANSEADTSFVDDLLGGLDLGDMVSSETESKEDKKRNIFSELDDDLNLMEDLPDAETIANTVELQPKISIWKRLFGNLKDDKWKKQKEKEEKLEAEKLAKAEEEKAKAAEAAAQSENGQEETKLDSKEAKKAEKQAKKEEKARKKEEKKAEKQKMKELAELEDTDEGRINRVGATIVFVFFGIIATFVIVGTNTFSYNSSISRATAYFDEDEYNSAYDALWGLEIKEKDAELYSKVQMVMYLNKEWNSYENYTNIRMYPEALDSLLKGIQKYDSHIDDAKELEVSADYKKIRKEILKVLKEEYGLTEKEAYKLLSIENQSDYSQEVIQLANES